MIRADSHYCALEMLDFCRAARIDFLLGVATTTTLRRHVETLEASTARRNASAPAGEKPRSYKEFHDGAASWARVERIIFRFEAGPQGTDTLFSCQLSATTLAGDFHLCRSGVRSVAAAGLLLRALGTNGAPWTDLILARRTVDASSGWRSVYLLWKIHKISLTSCSVARTLHSCSFIHTQER